MQETPYMRGTLPTERLEPRMLLAAQLIDQPREDLVEVASTQLIDVAATESPQLQSELASELRIDAIVNSLFEDDRGTTRQQPLGQSNAAYRQFVQAQQQRDLEVAETVSAVAPAPEDAFISTPIQASPQAPRGPPVATESSAFTVHERLVVVAPDVEDAEVLKDAFHDGATQFLVLTLGTDPISQITRQLERMAPVSSLHLFTHGSPGTIHLAGLDLDADTLSDRSVDLGAWSDHMAEEAPLLIYGCRVAENAGGKTLVRDLSDLLARPGSGLYRSYRCCRTGGRLGA